MKTSSIIFFTVVVAVVVTILSTTFTHAHRCIHDSDILPYFNKHHPPTTLDLRSDYEKQNGLAPQLRDRVAAAQEVTPKPIRFKMSYLDMYNSSRYCTEMGTMAQPNYVMDFKGGVLNCSSEDILTPAKRDALINIILPEALKRLSGALSVVPMNTTITGIHAGISLPFTVPQWMIDDGVNNSDCIVFVAAGMTPPGNVAWCGSTSISHTGRPIIGRMNVSPRYIKWQTKPEIERIVRTIIHEMLHFLGFSFDSLANNFFVPGRTNILAQGRKTRGGLTVTEMITPQVVAATRKFYDCPTVPGAELEIFGGEGTSGSHWARRNFYSSILSGVSGDLSQLDNITLSAFEDMGYYYANYSHAEPMYYGNQSGCEFLDEKCNSTNMRPKAQELFCRYAEPQQTMCSYNLRGIGKCNVVAFVSDLQPYFQYYPHPQVGGNTQLMQYCPFVDVFSNKKCNIEYNATGSDILLGHTHSAHGGRCVEAATLIEFGYQAVSSAPARCLVLKCMTQKNIAGVVQKWIQIKVRNAPWVDCSKLGEAGNITAPTGFSGTIVCPPYNEICVDGSKGFGDDLLFETLPDITTTTTTTTTTTLGPTTTTTTTTLLPGETNAPTTTVPGPAGLGGIPVIKSFFIGSSALNCSNLFAVSLHSTEVNAQKLKTAIATDVGTLLGFVPDNSTCPTVTERADGCVKVDCSIPPSKEITFSIAITDGSTAFLTTTSNLLASDSGESVSPSVLNLGTPNAPNSPGGTTTNANGYTTTTTASPGGSSLLEKSQGFAQTLCFIKDQECYISYIIISVGVMLLVSLIGWFIKKSKENNNQNNNNNPRQQQQQQPKRETPSHMQQEMDSMRNTNVDYADL